MPTIGWIDALRTYNAGMPSWCVPRKGTPGYERVMRIRQGEQTKGFKEVLEDLERKTSGKPKKEKKSMAIDLAEPSKEVQEVKVPTVAGDGVSSKTDRSTKKMSGSKNKKAMAVVPVNTVAEGGKKTREELVAEFEALTTERATLRHNGKTRTKAYKDLDERISRIGSQLGGIYAISGPNRTRVSVAERKS